MKARPIIVATRGRPGRRAKTEEDSDPSWPAPSRTVQTRSRSRQLDLSSFGLKVVRGYQSRNKDKEVEDNSKGNEKEVKNPSKLESEADEEIITPDKIVTIKKEVKETIKAKRGRPAKNLVETVVIQEKDKTKRDFSETEESKEKATGLVGKRGRVKDSSSSKTEIEVNKQETIKTGLVGKRGRIPKSNSSKTDKTCIKSEKKDNDSDTVIIESKKRTRNSLKSEIVKKAPKIRKCKKEPVDEDEEDLLDLDENNDTQETVVAEETQEIVESENCETETAVAENNVDVDDQVVKKQPIVLTELEAKKKLQDSLIVEKNTDEIFNPEVVIWGSAITQTIREVSNFFIVGSKESSASTTKNDQTNPNDSTNSNSNGLKQIINKPFTRRRAKPKPVQLMTLGEHKRILEACLNNPNGINCGDFKVDSLFRRGMETRRRSSNSSVYIDTVDTQDGPVRVETSTDPKSFTIGFEDGHIVIDDVANYECVDGTRGRKSCSHNKSCSECENHRRKRAPKLAIGLDGTWDPQCDEHGKPKCTYTDLIERALAENPTGLTVSEIYNWISSRFPYYSPNDDRWKNSVRHNLSINPYFKKGGKSKSGAGHVWCISEECQYFRPALKRRHTAGSLDMSKMKTDTDRAVASILGQYTKACADENHNLDESEDNGMSYCDDETSQIGFGAELPSSPPNFQNAAEIHDQQCPSNHMGIEMSDFNSVMQSTCLLNLEEYSHGQVIYVSQSQGDEDESNKENLDDTSPVEYTILESSSYMDSPGLISHSQVTTQDYASSQIIQISPEELETITSSSDMREITSSMGDIFDSQEMNLSFQFDSQGDPVQFR